MRFVESQAVYARYGIPLFPIRLNEDGSKRPLVRNFDRIGVFASAQLAKKFGDAPAFGFVCGNRSKITVLDVDDCDERVLANAMGGHGKTPLVVRTARRHFQAWYRWNGEQRRIRPNPHLPIDILGSGAVVAPNSSGVHGRYEIVEGSLEDIERLPALANIQSGASSDASTMGPDTGRNNWLFRQLGRDAHHCDDFDSLLDRARTLNEQFAVSLPDSEVVRAAKSVWKMTSEGRNRFGQYGAWISVNEIDGLVADPYLCTLLGWLRAHNRAGRTYTPSALQSKAESY
jgi:hypothetical protein